LKTIKIIFTKENKFTISTTFYRDQIKELVGRPLCLFLFLCLPTVAVAAVAVAAAAAAAVVVMVVTAAAVRIWQ
jgi:hypothetical protein